MVVVEGVVERKILSARVVRAIQSIKEVVNNHSDADIYAALQETNMDPNETAQKLLNQDPFHVVRRKKDKKKEVHLSHNTGHKGSTEARKPFEHVEQNVRSTPTDLSVLKGGFRGSAEARKPIEQAEQNVKPNPTDHGVPRGGYSRKSFAGGSREFRVVRDNRINRNMSNEVKPPSQQSSTSTSYRRSLQVSEKSSTALNQRSASGNYSPRQASAKQTVSENVVPETQVPKLNDSKQNSANNSVVGVYSSSSDPVHVPSPDSKSANVGAIKRELGAVGVRRQTSVIPSSVQSNLICTPSIVKDGISSEPLKSVAITSTIDQPSKPSEPESNLPSMPSSKSSSSNHYNSRPHQQLAGHQKASQRAKEWKRKIAPDSNVNRHGGSPPKSVPHLTDSSQDLEIDTTHAQEQLSRGIVYENQNVFIAEHIRVSDSERSRLIFGSFGTEADSSRTTASESLTVGAEDIPKSAVSISLSASIPVSPIVETSASNHVNLLDEQVRISGLTSEVSGESSENLLPDKKSTSSSQNLDHYTNTGLVHENNPSFARSESQQPQDPRELASFSVYNPQAGYDSPYFRVSMDESVRGQSLPSSQEVLSSHMANIPVSSISMVQQQQPLPQMYQQVHVSPYANLMPYRQYISPLYAPPIQMTGYSANPTYPHPSSGNNFVLMPGANNVKYGIQQYKPVPSSSPTGFGNFATPTGYAMNAPGVVGNATGLEESSRIKYKDGNLYVPNPQAETSEMWIQNPREFPSMQPASFYNMAGQTPHGTYMPPHPSHTTFNAASQSSHMQQFPGLYHPPPQVAAMANPHHLGPTLGAGSVNIGMASSAAVTPGAQMGAYQQSQMNHLNWNANF